MPQGDGHVKPGGTAIRSQNRRGIMRTVEGGTSLACYVCESVAAWRKAILVSACAGLVACDGISVGPWREAGSAEPPVDEMNKDLRLATLAPGEGQVVKAGDLVKVQIATIRTCLKNPGPTSFTGESKPVVLWLWTGKEPGLSDSSSCARPGSCNNADLWAEESRWGRLGDKSFRRALIGRSVGERFELAQGPDKEGYVAVPLYGFEVMFDNATLNDGRSHAWFPEMKIAHFDKFNQTQNIRAEAKILAACRGRLLRREAQMGEFTVRWSALEAKCTAPDEDVRLQVGPLHFSRGDPFQGSNFRWRQAYRSAHPPEKFPDEYGIRRPGPPGYEELCGRERP
jgi:hypothetical protein